MNNKFELHHGDCLEVLRGMPDNSVDSIVTDPPYGLSFMGRKWDYDVPSVEIWAECLRVLKPGGHLLAFAGTRTQHRMAVRIEDAGFEIRDMIAWVYGCLSEDSEVLTDDGWMPYNRAKQKNILAYDLQNDVYQWEKPARWNEYRVESDTAYRIQSDHTDQIVSRGHRCIVERGGILEFVPADELAGVERMPYLRGDISALPQGRGELLLQAVLRESKGLAQAALCERQGEEAYWQGACRGEKPGMEGRVDLLQAQGKIPGSVDQVRPLPCGIDEHVPQRRVCDGASACSGAGDWQTADAGGMCAPHQPRRDGQPAGEPDVVCQQRGSQAVRARTSYQTTLATVTAIEYSGMIWCPTVSTGAFVARRNGKVFITGNSGFPKSLDVSRAIDKAQRRNFVLAAVALGMEIPGNNLHDWTKAEHSPGDKWWGEFKAILSPEQWGAIEREVVGQRTTGIGTGGGSTPIMGDGNRDVTAPATEAARQWQGWGTALKPALEPVTVARKPLIGTVAANVLAHGTGAINVDASRIMTADQERDAAAYRRLSFLGSASCIRGLSRAQLRGSLLHIASVLRSCSTGGTDRSRSADDLDGTLLDHVLCERLVARLFPSGAWCGGSSWLAPDSLCGCQSCRHSCDGHIRLLREAAQDGFPSLADALERICSSQFGLEHNRVCQCIDRLSSSDDSLLAWSFSFLANEYCTLYSATPHNARWPANLIHDGSEEVLAGFPTSNSPWIGNNNQGAKGGKMFGGGDQSAVSKPEYRDEGSAARFFYCAKASKRDRGEGNIHPTVKPTDLMAYLCRLVNPTNGIVLDPFMGSGSTGKAAMREGFRFIGIERESEYLQIARARIEYELRKAE